MADRLLYAIPVPDTAQSREGSRNTARLAKQSTLSEDVANVEQVATEANQQTFTGRAYGKHAELTAAEIEELLAASAIEAVPYFVRGTGTSKKDAYYSLEDVTIEPEDPREPRMQRFDGVITRRGTRRSHWRAVRTATEDVDNPFGSATSEEIAINARADKVWWWDELGKSRTKATVQRTETGEHDDIDIYDITQVSGSFSSEPVLLYTLPYRFEYGTDCRVWDDRNVDKVDVQSDGNSTVGSATVGSSTVDGETTAVQWQRVFATDHEFSGTPILENDLLRIELDETDQTVRAYEWDDADSIYATKTLGNSAWRLYDVDLRRIGLEAVDAELVFENTSAGSLTVHRLNVSLKRGYTGVQFTNPESSSVPSGLQTRLSPIADDSDRDPSAVTDVVRKAEVP